MLSAVIPSVRSYPAVRLAPQPVHQRYVPPGPLVLGRAPRKSQTPTADRDRTVSRRSKPSSRTALNGEQPYPWDLLQPQDAMSRHRGAKRRRRYGLLGVISLLSPAYLLSVERWPFHAGPPDHYGRLSTLLGPSSGPRTLSGGEFDWGGRLLNGNGGVRRFPQAVWKSAFECKGISRVNCETNKSSRWETRP